MDFSALERQYNLPAGILGRMEQTESGGNQYALSGKGAQGYFQFLPDTAKQYNVNPYDLNSAAQGAARYLSDLYKQTGSMEKAVAAYNWGPGNLEKQGYQNAPAETKAYVRKVMGQNTAPTLTPVDYDPFAQKPQSQGSHKLVPVNYDPFAQKTAPKQPPAVEKPWYDKALDAAGRFQSKVVRGIGNDLLGVAGGVAQPLWNAVGTIPYKPLQDFASKESNIAGNLGSRTGNAIGQGAAMAGGVLATGGASLPEMAGGALGRIAGTGAITGLLSGLTAPVGEKLHAANVGALAGGAIGAAGEAAPAVLGGAKNAYQYLRHPEMGAGATGARRMAADLQGLVPKAGAEPQAPTPIEPPRSVDLTPQATPPAVSKVNNDLMQQFNTKADALEATRKKAGTGIEAALAKRPMGQLADTHPLAQSIDALQQQLIKAAGNSPKSADSAYNNIIASLDRAQNESHDPINVLVELRRELSQKASFGDSGGGYAAIGEKRAGDISRKLNEIIDEHVPGYAEARAGYKGALDDQEPMRAKLLKSVGADETTGGDLTKRIMESPQNVDKAIEALGNAKPIDQAISQRVTADLAGKNAEQANAYFREHELVLQKLPGAAKTAQDLVSKAEARDALQGLQKRLQTRFTEQTKAQNDAFMSQHAAWARSHDIAQRYTTDFTQLGAATPTQLPTRLRSILGKMADPQTGGGAPLISQTQLTEALTKVNALEKQINRQAAVRNYAVKLGIPALALYAFKRQAWDIVMRLIK